MEVVLVCKDCEEKMDYLDLNNCKVGDIIECESCGAEHELVSLDPCEIVLVEEEK